MRPHQHEKTNTALYLFCAERQEHHKPLFGLSINNVMQPDFAHNLQCLATVMYFALDDSIFFVQQFHVAFSSLVYRRETLADFVRSVVGESVNCFLKGTQKV